MHTVIIVKHKSNICAKHLLKFYRNILFSDFFQLILSKWKILTNLILINKLPKLTYLANKLGKVLKVIFFYAEN